MNIKEVTLLVIGRENFGKALYEWKNNCKWKKIGIRTIKERA
jgi:hypothetical protein